MANKGQHDGNEQERREKKLGPHIDQFYASVHPISQTFLIQLPQRYGTNEFHRPTQQAWQQILTDIWALHGCREVSPSAIDEQMEISITFDSEKTEFFSNHDLSMLITHLLFRDWEEQQ